MRINQMDNKHIIQRPNKSKQWFFERTNKLINHGETDQEKKEKKYNVMKEKGTSL